MFTSLAWISLEVNKHYHAWTRSFYRSKVEAWRSGNPRCLFPMELPNPRRRALHKTTCYRVSTIFYIPSGGTYCITFYCLYTDSFLPTVIPFLLIRAFQEYENLTATLENNRNYLSDSYGDFLYNNDEYLWTPVRTYYKKRLL